MKLCARFSPRFSPRFSLALCATLLVFSGAFSVGCEDDPRDKAFLKPDAGSDASTGTDAAMSGNDSGTTPDSGAGDSGAPDTGIGTGSDAGDDAGDAN